MDAGRDRRLTRLITAPGGSQPGRGAELSLVGVQPHPLQDARVLQRNCHAERAEALHTLELAEVQLLHLAGQVAQALQVLDVPAVLAALRALAVDDCDLAGLGYAVRGAFHHGFVDALLDDLIADVVRAVDVEALLVETEADRARRVLYQNEMGSLEG